MIYVHCLPAVRFIKCESNQKATALIIFFSIYFLHSLYKMMRDVKQDSYMKINGKIGVSLNESFVVKRNNLWSALVLSFWYYFFLLFSFIENAYYGKGNMQTYINRLCLVHFVLIIRIIPGLIVDFRICFFLSCCGDCFNWVNISNDVPTCKVILIHSSVHYLKFNKIRVKGNWLSQYHITWQF